MPASLFKGLVEETASEFQLVRCALFLVRSEVCGVDELIRVRLGLRDSQVVVPEPATFKRTAVDIYFPLVVFTGIAARPILCVPSGFPRLLLSCCEAFNRVGVLASWGTSAWVGIARSPVASAPSANIGLFPGGTFMSTDSSECTAGSSSVLGTGGFDGPFDGTCVAMSMERELPLPPTALLPLQTLV